MATPKRPSDFATHSERSQWVRDNPNATITCTCNGRGCTTCGGDGHIPAWTVDPTVTGHPHERRRA